jgi:alpha-glucosidase
VIGNHDVPRPASRYQLDEGFTPGMIEKLISAGQRNAQTGARRARAAALLLLALPGSAYIYQGEELGQPEVTDLPDDARRDPTFRLTGGRIHGRDGCRVPIPWSRTGASFGFSRTDTGTSPGPPWLPQPAGWGSYSVEAQLADPESFLGLYRAAVRLRREHPALGRGGLRWLGEPQHPESPHPQDLGLLCFARDPGFIFAANLGAVPVPLPPHDKVLLASEPISGNSLPPDTAAWLSV